jgi:hypothetical protein
MPQVTLIMTARSTDNVQVHLLAGSIISHTEYQAFQTIAAGRNLFYAHHSFHVFDECFDSDGLACGYVFFNLI